MLHYKQGKTLVMFADDLHDAAQFIKDTPRAWIMHSSQDSGRDYDWDLGTGWERALELANTGWTEGALDLSDKLAALPPNETEPEYTYDVAGYMPDVGLYCAGDPMHMLNAGHPEGRKPIVHLVINVVCSDMTRADAFKNYGTAITAMVGQIEASGRRVELDCVFVDHLKDGTTAIMGWKVKRAADHIDLSAVAYSLAHPAAFRRIGFAFIERTPRSCETYGYGRCASLTKELAGHIGAGEAFLLEGVGTQGSACSTVADALRLAAQQINQAAGETLVEVRE